MSEIFFICTTALIIYLIYSGLKNHNSKNQSKMKSSEYVNKETISFYTHYDNLKVTRDAPVNVIKAAYKTLCQTFHPDKYSGSKEEAEKIMKNINASYEVLIDPVKRAKYDDWIREQESHIK